MRNAADVVELNICFIFILHKLAERWLNKIVELFLEHFIYTCDFVYIHCIVNIVRLHRHLSIHFSQFQCMNWIRAHTAHMSLATAVIYCISHNVHFTIYSAIDRNDLCSSNLLYFFFFLFSMNYIIIIIASSHLIPFDLPRIEAYVVIGNAICVGKIITFYFENNKCRPFFFSTLFNK